MKKKKMKNIFFVPMLCLLFLSVQLNAQENQAAPVPTDVISTGLGIGQDYGGLGVHMIVYPQRNIGIFGGLGNRVGDLGYNVGLKLRFLSPKPTARINHYILGMYGYNAVVVVGDVLSAGLHKYDKMFYGPTVGMGFDFKLRPMSRFYGSFGLHLPIRGSQVDDYIEDLRINESLDVSNDLSPVTLSIGFKYMIVRK